jgi:hypothetical protein
MVSAACSAGRYSLRMSSLTPGVGRLMREAVGNRDYVLLQGSS